jgi:ribosome-associated toxin RatA of RatAB toxin-antitoxin module
VEIRRSLVASCSQAELFALVDDLDRYPAWMPLVRAVTRDEADAPDDPDGGATQPAWTVEIQATVGRFARSKRLRMVRVVHDPFRRVRFERAERDGRSHAAWTLEAVLDEPTASQTRLAMTLHYGGSLWSGAVLQRILDDHVRRGSEALVEAVESTQR